MKNHNNIKMKVAVAFNVGQMENHNEIKIAKSSPF